MLIVEIQCDVCHTVGHRGETRAAQAYTMLRRLGWRQDGAADYCPQCWPEVHKTKLRELQRPAGTPDGGEHGEA